MTVHKLRGQLQAYFEHIVGQRIEQAALFDNELVFTLTDESELCIYAGEDGLIMQINEKPKYND